MNSSVNFAGLGRIVLTFQKKGCKDDTLVVTPDSQTDGYNVSFVQNTIRTNSENYLTNDKLIPYLDRLIRALEFDAEPYDCVQFDCPTYPTVIIEKDNLQDYFYVLSEQISSLQSSWPYEKSGVHHTEAKRSSKSYNGEGRLYFTMQKDGKKDDVLSVYPEHNGFSVRFEQNEILNTTEWFVNSSDITPYIERFFTTISYDAEPCNYVQVDFPLYPTVLITKSNILAYLPLLSEQITEQVESFHAWPTESSGKHFMNPRSDYDWDVLAY